MTIEQISAALEGTIWEDHIRKMLNEGFDDADNRPALQQSGSVSSDTPVGLLDLPAVPDSIRREAR
ncbi:hypothetical protein EBT31_00245 [bacterium]|jgi:hypothetical protein|nr:hypothetical protein [bacterium]